VLLLLQSYVYVVIMEGSVVEPCVIFRCTAKPGPIKKTAIMSAVFRVKNSFLRRLTKGVTSRCLLLKDGKHLLSQQLEL